MRSDARALHNMVQYKARTDPRIRALVERLGGLSAADIEALPVEKWVRMGLLELKAKQRAEIDTARAEKLVEQGMRLRIMSSPEGAIRRWTGGRQFLPLDRGNMVEIDSGKLVWLPTTGGFWFETIFSHCVPPLLLANTVAVGAGKKLDYMQRYRALVNATPDAGLPTIDLTGQTNSPTNLSGISIPGVRFGS